MTSLVFDERIVGAGPIRRGLSQIVTAAPCGASSLADIDVSEENVTIVDVLIGARVVLGVHVKPFVMRRVLELLQPLIVPAGVQVSVEFAALRMDIPAFSATFRFRPLLSEAS